MQVLPKMWLHLVRMGVCLISESSASNEVSFVDAFTDSLVGFSVVPSVDIVVRSFVGFSRGIRQIGQSRSAGSSVSRSTLVKLLKKACGIESDIWTFAHNLNCKTGGGCSPRTQKPSNSRGKELGGFAVSDVCRSGKIVRYSWDGTLLSTVRTLRDQ